MTDTINIPRAELQAALDALQECRQKIAYLLGNVEWYESAQAIDFADISIKAISARLAVDVCAEKQPDVEKTSQRVEKTAQQGEKAADPCIDGSCDCCWADKKQEPVGEVDKDGMAVIWTNKPMNNAKLYTTPLKRPWQGLTDDEIWNADEIMAANSECGASFETLRELVHAISDKLKEKNNG